MYRIVAVEDDPLMQKMLKDTLEAYGFEFQFCPDGAAGLAVIPAVKPDLILLDVNLPDLSGHELCRRLKAQPSCRHIPILMLTGEVREVASRVEGLELGAEDYLFKPISPKILISRIKSILKTARPIS